MRHAARIDAGMVPTSVDFSSFDILVVEDNLFLRKLINEILTSFGVGRIRQANSADAAMLEIKQQPPDMIFCDWVMPGSGGLTLLRALRRDNAGRYPRIPVIVISGHATDDHVAQAIGEGADSYVVKPFTVNTVMQHVLKVIAKDEGAVYLE
jgi:CheY-like chemotaxis protein